MSNNDMFENVWANPLSNTLSDVGGPLTLGREESNNATIASKQVEPMLNASFQSPLDIDFAFIENRLDNANNNSDVQQQQLDAQFPFSGDSFTIPNEMADTDSLNSASEISSPSSPESPFSPSIQPDSNTPNSPQSPQSPLLISQHPSLDELTITGSESASDSLLFIPMSTSASATVSATTTASVFSSLSLSSSFSSSLSSTMSEFTSTPVLTPTSAQTLAHFQTSSSFMSSKLPSSFPFTSIVAASSTFTVTPPPTPPIPTSFHSFSLGFLSSTNAQTSISNTNTINTNSTTMPLHPPSAISSSFLQSIMPPLSIPSAAFSSSAVASTSTSTSEQAKPKPTTTKRGGRKGKASLNTVLLPLVMESQASVSQDSNVDADSGGGPDDKKSKRERNKMSAMKYRRRRKVYMDSLEEKVTELSDTVTSLATENKLLKEQLSFLKNLIPFKGSGDTTSAADIAKSMRAFNASVNSSSSSSASNGIIIDNYTALPPKQKTAAHSNKLSGSTVVSLFVIFFCVTLNILNPSFFIPLNGPAASIASNARYSTSSPYAGLVNTPPPPVAAGPTPSYMTYTGHFPIVYRPASRVLVGYGCNCDTGFIYSNNGNNDNNNNIDNTDINTRINNCSAEDEEQERCRTLCLQYQQSVSSSPPSFSSSSSVSTSQATKLSTARSASRSAASQDFSADSFREHRFSVDSE